MRKLFFIVSLAFLPNAAFACKLGAEATDLGAFLRANSDSQVVFLGKVTRTQELPRTTSEMAGTDCAGIFDFSARVGEQWLVVGTWWNGQIHPSGLLSVRLNKSGKLPAEIKAQLGRISEK